LEGEWQFNKPKKTGAIDISASREEGRKEIRVVRPGSVMTREEKELVRKLIDLLPVQVNVDPSRVVDLLFDGRPETYRMLKNKFLIGNSTSFEKLITEKPYLESLNLTFPPSFLTYPAVRETIYFTPNLDPAPEDEKSGEVYGWLEAFREDWGRVDEDLVQFSTGLPRKTILRMIELHEGSI
jgi:hypothetical protein